MFSDSAWCVMVIYKVLWKPVERRPS